MRNLVVDEAHPLRIVGSLLHHCKAFSEPEIIHMGDLDLLENIPGASLRRQPVIEKFGKSFLEARDPFLRLVKFSACAEPCRQGQHSQSHALMCELLTSLLREPHDIASA